MREKLKKKKIPEYNSGSNISFMFRRTCSLLSCLYIPYCASLAALIGMNCLIVCLIFFFHFFPKLLLLLCWFFCLIFVLIASRFLHSRIDRAWLIKFNPLMALTEIEIGLNAIHSNAQIDSDCKLPYIVQPYRDMNYN